MIEQKIRQTSSALGQSTMCSESELLRLSTFTVNCLVSCTILLCQILCRGHPIELKLIVLVAKIALVVHDINSLAVLQSLGITIEEVIDDKKFKMIEEDVSDVMGEQYWSMKEDLKANITNTMVENLPKPVIIFKKLAKGAKLVERQVIVSPEESNKRYGNLLDKYLIVSSVQ